jgi:hypothetical protein
MLAFFVVSCEKDAVQKPNEQVDVITSVVVNPDSVELNGTVDIIVNVENHGSTSLELDFSYLNQIGFIINITDSSYIYYPSGPDSPALSHLSVPAGESHEVQIPFSTRKSATGNTLWRRIEEDSLVVGTYEIKAGLIGYSEEYPWGKATFYIVEKTF